MTNPINCSNQSIPAYSGITINITSPTLNAAPLNQCYPSNCPECYPQKPEFSVKSENPAKYGMTVPLEQSQTFTKSSTVENNQTNDSANTQNTGAQAYPPQYYLNNYNYVQNGEKGNSQTANKPSDTISNIPTAANPDQNVIQEEDLSSSQGIIDELDSRIQEQKDLEKNGKQTRVIALTNEYIMSLENYLNNPNTEIRLMASKEILTRLDEDKNRFDDAALNALLNKMLQDPEKLVRIAALSAFSSQLASGNDYTVQLLTNIQNDPNADKEDVLQAADSLLKMSSSTEIKYTPTQNDFVAQQQVEKE